MNIKLFSCLSIFGRKSLNNKTLFGCYKQCYLFSSSTKKNKKIVEKPNLELNISERLSKNEKFQDPKNKKELQINENENKPNTETLNIVQELKSKRYIYDENSQKVISLDLNKKEEKNPDYIIEKPQIPEEKTERLSKYLSRAGICSRREAERLIKQGMISVNKKKIFSNVSVTNKSDIKIFTKDGFKTPLKENTKLWMFYKPQGLISSASDPENRPNIFDYLRNRNSLKIEHIISVGSLDFNSEGLLLLTNDGEVARVLELPITKLQKDYHVRVYGSFTAEKLLRIRQGVVINGFKYGPFWTEILNRQTSNTWIHMRMETGKIREIRRIMQKFDLRVNRLKRISFGPYKIGSLKPGDIVEITIAPQIKKVLYFNVRHKLKELKEKIKEQIGEDTEKNMLSYKEKKGIEETLGRKKLLSKRNSLKIIEKKQ